MMRKYHVRFLWEWHSVTSVAYQVLRLIQGMNKMKKLYAIAFAALSFNAVAGDEVEKFRAQLKAQYKLLDNEIRIVKLKDFMKPSIKNDEDQKRIMKSIANMRQTKKEMDKIGYITKE